MIPYYPVILVSDKVAQLLREDPYARERFDQFRHLVRYEVGPDFELEPVPYRVQAELKANDLVFARVYTMDESRKINLYEYPRNYRIYRKFKDSPYYTMDPGYLFNTLYLDYDGLSVEVKISPVDIEYRFEREGATAIWVEIPKERFSQIAPIVLQEVCQYYDTDDPYVFSHAPRFMSLPWCKKVVVHYINKKLQKIGKTDSIPHKYSIEYNGEIYSHSEIRIDSQAKSIYTYRYWSQNSQRYVEVLTIPLKYAPPWVNDTGYGERYGRKI